MAFLCITRYPKTAVFLVELHLYDTCVFIPLIVANFRFPGLFHY